MNRRLEKAGITLIVKGEPKRFNNYHWNTFVKFYGMKSEERYAHDRSLKNEKNSSYVYSQQAVEAVVSAIKQDPIHVIERMIDEQKEKNKPTPGAREF